MRCSWTPTTEVLHRGNYPDTHEVQLKHQTELQLSESVTLNAESRAQSPQVYNRWSTTAGLQAQIDTCDTNLEGCDARHVQDVKMWKAAADPAYEGDCDEQTNLGYAYLSGRGVAINISTAIYWWTKASNQVSWPSCTLRLHSMLPAGLSQSPRIPGKHASFPSSQRPYSYRA